jgi:hypothetical protein
VIRTGVPLGPLWTERYPTEANPWRPERPRHAELDNTSLTVTKGAHRMVDPLESATAYNASVAG